LITAVFTACGLSISPMTSWAGDFPEAGVDSAPSLARFVFTLSRPFINRQEEPLRTKLRERFCPKSTWLYDRQEKRWKGTPSCTEAERTFISPYMYEAQTRIGRSEPHDNGSRNDKGYGTRVCQDGVNYACDSFFPKRIKDQHFFPGMELDEMFPNPGFLPTDFVDGPTKVQEDTGVPVREVHTQMLTMDLKPLGPPYNTQEQYKSANGIRAGTAAPEQPGSIGEVESLSNDGLGFPAESFFNMNVEVDVDLDNSGDVDFTLISGSEEWDNMEVIVEDDPNTEEDESEYEEGKILLGTDALVIQGHNLQSFPPKLVYVHNATLWAVSMYDKAVIDATQNGQDGHVGWLRLAGHGIQFGPKPTANDLDGNRKGVRDGLMDDLAIFDNVIEKMPILPVSPVEVQHFEKEPPRCQLYVLQDHKRNNSQIYSIAPDNFEVKPLSQIYPGLDLEGMDTRPDNDLIYATSGNDSEHPGYLYRFNIKTGKLTEIGATGFGDVPSIDFHSDGTLWGWVKGKGLITIDIKTGKGTMVKAFPGVLVEDITWNNAGTHIYASDNTNLLIYDHANQTAEVACSNLPGETEALEMLPDGSLLLGIHGERKILQFQAINLETCEIVFGLDVPTNATINDVEGIAWPINLCSQP